MWRYFYVSGYINTNNSSSKGFKKSAQQLYKILRYVAHSIFILSERNPKCVCATEEICIPQHAFPLQQGRKKSKLFSFFKRAVLHHFSERRESLGLFSK